jgi:positive regulator of sigma E activity
MNENQLLESSKLMFLQNSGRKDEIDFLTQNGILEEKAEIMATDAYRAIKDQRKEMIQEVEVEEKKSVGKSVIIGFLILIAGIIATMVTDRIWYGAMIVGVIAIAKGVIGSSTKS